VWQLNGLEWREAGSELHSSSPGAVQPPCSLCQSPGLGALKEDGGDSRNRGGEGGSSGLRRDRQDPRSCLPQGASVGGRQETNE
jgi:hypothetical protein